MQSPAPSFHRESFHFHRHQPITLWLCLLVLLGSAAFAAPPRYVGRTQSGQLVTAQEVGWRPQAVWPELDGRAHDGPDHLAWLVDRHARLPSATAARVELVGGDCLPGTVLEYRDGRTDSSQAFPPHFVVQTNYATREAASVRVLADDVRRIIWQPPATPTYTPDRCLFRDGSGVAFRSIRLNETGVRLLLEDGQQLVPYDDIAALHFAAADPWQQYVRALSRMEETSTSHCLQLVNVDGLVATTTVERFRRRRDEGLQRNREHVLQPSWCLDRLRVPVEQIRQWRFWAANELPLTWFSPSNVRQSSRMGHVVWPWREGLTVTDHPLTGLTQPYGWGYGVHGSTEIEFQLPPAAIGFRATAALDRSDLPGLVRVAAVSGSDQPIDELLSAEAPRARLALSWPRGAVSRRLRLITEPQVTRDAPANVFDLAAAVHWGDPVVKLDPGLLDAAINEAGTE